MIYENLSYNASFKDKNKINISFIKGAKIAIFNRKRGPKLFRFFHEQAEV